jgi:hypothetical protein
VQPNHQVAHLIAILLILVATHIYAAAAAAAAAAAVAAAGSAFTTAAGFVAIFEYSVDDCNVWFGPDHCVVHQYTIALGM